MLGNPALGFSWERRRERGAAAGASDHPDSGRSVDDDCGHAFASTRRARSASAASRLSISGSGAASNSSTNARNASGEQSSSGFVRTTPELGGRSAGRRGNTGNRNERLGSRARGYRAFRGTGMQRATTNAERVRPVSAGSAHPPRRRAPKRLRTARRMPARPLPRSHRSAPARGRRSRRPIAATPPRAQLSGATVPGGAREAAATRRPGSPSEFLLVGGAVDALLWRSGIGEGAQSA